jgi:hypothetical protein
MPHHVPGLVPHFCDHSEHWPVHGYACTHVACSCGYTVLSRSSGKVLKRYKNRVYMYVPSQGGGQWLTLPVTVIKPPAEQASSSTSETERKVDHNDSAVDRSSDYDYDEDNEELQARTPYTYDSGDESTRIIDVPPTDSFLFKASMAIADFLLNIFLAFAFMCALAIAYFFIIDAARHHHVYVNRFANDLQAAWRHWISFAQDSYHKLDTKLASQRVGQHLAEVKDNVLCVVSYFKTKVFSS